jgi:hypothetical protein
LRAMASVLWLEKVN